MVGIGRRGLLRGALLAATAGALGVAAGGCAARARPQGAGAVTLLKFAPWGGWTGIGQDWTKFIRPPLDSFEQANPGLRIQVMAPVEPGRALPEIIGGTAPDVFSEYDIVPYMEHGGLLVDLAPLLQRDNISTAIWSAGQMTQFYTGSGLWFLPNYLNVAVMAVNLGDLDELGLAYPANDWTSEEALQLFQAATSDRGGKHRYGFSPVFRGLPYKSSGPLPNALYALEIFGGSVIDPTRTRCTLDDPRVVRAAEWWVEMFTNGVATSEHSPLASPWRATFVENRNNHLMFDARNWTKQYKWQFMPIPKYPAGQMSWVGSEGYGLSIGAKDREAAWTFLKFLAVDTAWQRYGMKIVLKPPSILSLWPEMTAIMEQVVPGFVGKGLHWYAESAASWARAVPDYKYNPVGVMNVVNAAFADILSGKVSPAAGLRAATRQVNAIQTQGPVLAESAKASSSRFPSVGPTVTAVPVGL